MDMVRKTEFTVSLDDIKKSWDICYSLKDFKNVINYPSGDFFYDPWIIKDEFKGTVIEKFLNALPFSIGEARIIKLETGKAYHKHADIDDRYHLNLFGDESYLIDLGNLDLFPMTQDGIWYEMDTSKLHTAISIGQHNRYQIVVRKLLQKNVLKNYKNVTVELLGDNPRYVFDNTLSPWLNKSNKLGYISNFKKVNSSSISFDIEYNEFDSFKKILPSEFRLKLVK